MPLDRKASVGGRAKYRQLDQTIRNPSAIICAFSAGVRLHAISTACNFHRDPSFPPSPPPTSLHGPLSTRPQPHPPICESPSAQGQLARRSPSDGPRYRIVKFLPVKTNQQPIKNRPLSDR